MITRKELQEELKGFATRDDLERFATKDDLKRFATKDDLERFATKDDLKETRRALEHATQEVIRQTRVLFEDFRAEIRAWIEVADVRKRVDSLDNRVHRVERRLDGVELSVQAIEKRTQ